MIFITFSPGLWLQALIIAITHLLIDAAKLQWQKPATKRVWFFIDQLLHLLTIVIVWAHHENMIFDTTILTDKKFLVYLAGLLFLIKPTSYIIKTVISRWEPAHVAALQNPQSPTGNVNTDSLINAGNLIGILERLLVLVFIITGKWEGVGFLLAAKSVFRFGDLKDAKDMKLTEYVLIGTLLSFGIAIITSLIMLKLLAK